MAKAYLYAMMHANGPNPLTWAAGKRLAPPRELAEDHPTVKAEAPQEPAPAPTPPVQLTPPQVPALRAERFGADYPDPRRYR